MMQRQRNVPKPLGITFSQPSQPAQQLRRRLTLLTAVVILALATLACSLLNRVISSVSEEPTSQAETGSEESPATSSTVAPAPANSGDSIGTAGTSMPLNIPDVDGWSFTGVQAQFNPNAGGLQVYGDLINNTDTTQELQSITGTVFDAQGQAISPEGSAIGYSPLFLIPPGGRAPFGLTVLGIQNTANIHLIIEAKPSESSLRQNFEFLDLKEREEEYGYCIDGVVQNPGEVLQDSLVFAAVLYNDQDNVISFIDSYISPADLADGQSLEFEICVDPFGQEVARYELRAWGR